MLVLAHLLSKIVEFNIQFSRFDLNKTVIIIEEIEKITIKLVESLIKLEFMALKMFFCLFLEFIFKHQNKFNNLKY